MWMFWIAGCDMDDILLTCDDNAKKIPQRLFSLVLHGDSGIDGLMTGKNLACMEYWNKLNSCFFKLKKNIFLILNFDIYIFFPSNFLFLSRRSLNIVVDIFRLILFFLFFFFVPPLFSLSVFYVILYFLIILIPVIFFKWSPYFPLFFLF